jgi:hypothetical protein
MHQTTEEAIKKHAPDPTRTAMFPVQLCTSLTHTPGLKRELDRRLWETHTIANYSVDAYGQLLLAAANGKLGATSQERTLVASYIRVMLNLPINKKQLLGLEGRPKGEGGKFNFHYHFTKLTRPAESAATAYAEIKKLADVIPKLLESKELKAAKRPVLQELLADCVRAAKALEYFQKIGHFPLAAAERAIVSGLTAPVKNVATLLQTGSTQSEAGVLDAKWQSILLTHAAQRVKSYLGLKAKWDLDIAEFRTEVPEWRKLEGIIQELKPPTLRSDGLARLAWIRTHGRQLASEGQVATKFVDLGTEDGKLKIGEQYSKLFTLNPGLETCVDKILTLARLNERAPTFTRCDPIRHPMRIVVPAPQSGGGYRDLTIRPDGMGSVTLKTLHVENGSVVSDLTTFPVRVDRRLLQVSAPTALEPRGEEGETPKVIRKFFDRSLGTLHRSVVLRGARISPLIDPAAGRADRNRTQLEITVDISIPKVDAPRRWSEIEEGSKIVLVSFGHLFGATRDCISLLTKERGTARLDLRSWLRVQNEANTQDPTLRKHATMFESLRAHQESLDARRSESGKLARGQRYASDEQQHLNNLTTDQVRKEANLIVKNAMKNGASIIAIPYLEGVNPTKFQDEVLNRLFMSKARARVVEYLKGVAARAGIAVVELSPYGMRDLCGECGEVGSIVEATQLAEPHFGCSCCKALKPAVENSADNLRMALMKLGEKGKDDSRTAKWTEFLKLEKPARRTFREERRSAAEALLLAR